MKDYLLIQDKNTGLGQIAVSHAVVNEIVKNVIDRDENIFFDDIRGLKSGADISVKGDNLSILLKVRIQYGKHVEQSCVKLQKELSRQLELMVDYHNPTINFNVVGFKFD